MIESKYADRISRLKAAKSKYETTLTENIQNAQNSASEAEALMVSELKNENVELYEKARSNFNYYSAAANDYKKICDEYATKPFIDTDEYKELVADIKEEFREKLDVLYKKSIPALKDIRAIWEDAAELYDYYNTLLREVQCDLYKELDIPVHLRGGKLIHTSDFYQNVGQSYRDELIMLFSGTFGKSWDDFDRSPMKLFIKKYDNN